MDTFDRLWFDDPNECLIVEDPVSQIDIADTQSPEKSPLSEGNTPTFLRLPTSSE